MSRSLQERASFLGVGEIFLESNQNAYFAALSVVAESGGPLGAWYLRRALAEKGVQTLLVPVSCRRQVNEMSDDLAARLTVVYYLDVRDALLKAMVE